MKEEIIEIRKYSNRRLYDTSTSHYVKLSDVAEMIRQGKEICVVDAKTNEDLTKSIMLQIICENKPEQEALPIGFLRNVIQAGNKAIRDSIKDYLSFGLNRQYLQKQMTQWAKLSSLNPLFSIFLDHQKQNAPKVNHKNIIPNWDSFFTHFNDFSEYLQHITNLKMDAQDEHLSNKNHHSIPQKNDAKSIKKDDELASLQQQLMMMQEKLDILLKNKEEK